MDFEKSNSHFLFFLAFFSLVSGYFSFSSDNSRCGAGRSHLVFHVEVRPLLTCPPPSYYLLRSHFSLVI